jgi:hypothetical protein
MEKPYLPRLADDETAHGLELALLFEQFGSDQRQDLGQRVTRFPKIRQIAFKPGTFQALFENPSPVSGIELFLAFGYMGAFIGGDLSIYPATLPVHLDLHARNSACTRKWPKYNSTRDFFKVNKQCAGNARRDNLWSLWGRY